MLILDQKTPLANIMDLCIVSKSNTGDRELSFTIPVSDPAYRQMAEEREIELQGDGHYNIKSIEERGETAQVTCRLNLDVFLVGGVLDYREEAESLSHLLTFCITGTGWTQEGAETVGKKVTNELEAGNVLDLMGVAQENYGVVFAYDTYRKKITVKKPESATHKGCYLTEELNLSDLSLRADTYDLCTRIIPIGAEGMTIETVNGGKNYLDNHTYTNKIITRVWRDERYEDAQSLKDAAMEQLKRQAVPVRVYDGAVINVAELSADYRQLAFAAGDIVTLIDVRRGIRADYEIVSHTHYPEEPERDAVEINTAAETYEQVIEGLVDQTQQMFVSDRKKISQITQDIDGIYTRVEDTYTRGETQTYVGSQIQQEADRIDAVVSKQQTTINGLSQTVVDNKTEIDLALSGIRQSVSQNTTEISGTKERVTQAEAELLIQAKQISSTVSDLQSINGRVTSAESTITQQAREIALKVDENGVIAAINLTPETAKISARYLDLQGYVTFSGLDGELSDYVTDTDLSTLGRTTINGGNITTNNLYVNRIWGGIGTGTGYAEVNRGYGGLGTVGLSLYNLDDNEIFHVGERGGGNYVNILLKGNEFFDYNTGTNVAGTSVKFVFDGDVNFRGAVTGNFYAKFK